MLLNTPMLFPFPPSPTPIITVTSHWSLTHPFPATGGNDSRLNIWNLRVGPHYLAGSVDGFSSPVTSVNWSCGRASKCIGVTAHGELIGVQLSSFLPLPSPCPSANFILFGSESSPLSASKFLAPLAVSRPLPPADGVDIMQEVERGIYTRSFSDAFSKALFLSGPCRVSPT